MTVGLTAIGMASRARKQLVRDLTAQMTELHRLSHEAIEKLEREQDMVRSQVGEAIAGFRQTLTDLGFFIRDNYVKDSELREAVVSIKEQIHVSTEKLEARCLRIETEIRQANHWRDRERKGQ